MTSGDRLSGRPSEKRLFVNYFTGCSILSPGMIKGMGMIGANYGGDDRIVMVHPGDIAAVASEELETLSSGIKVRYVASDDLRANYAAEIKYAHNFNITNSLLMKTRKKS